MSLLFNIGAADTCDVIILRREYLLWIDVSRLEIPRDRKILCFESCYHPGYSDFPFGHISIEDAALGLKDGSTWPSATRSR